MSFSQGCDSKIYHYISLLSLKISARMWKNTSQSFFTLSFWNTHCVKLFDLEGEHVSSFMSNWIVQVQLKGCIWDKHEEGLCAV